MSIGQLNGLIIGALNLMSILRWWECMHIQTQGVELFWVFFFKAPMCAEFFNYLNFQYCSMYSDITPQELMITLYIWSAMSNLNNSPSTTAIWYFLLGNSWSMNFIICYNCIGWNTHTVLGHVFPGGGLVLKRYLIVDNLW